MASRMVIWVDTVREPSVVQSPVGKAFAAYQPSGGVRINPRDLAECSTHFHAQLVPIASSEVQEPHRAVPIVWLIVKEAATGVVKLISEVTHDLSISVFGEARQLGDQTPDKAKLVLLRRAE